VAPSKTGVLQLMPSRMSKIAARSSSSLMDSTMALISGEPKTSLTWRLSSSKTTPPSSMRESWWPSS